MHALQADPRSVHTPAFDGPLELLLYLIRRDGIDVRELPVAHITREYLTFLERMEVVDLDEAGDFLVMAATLCMLKSRELLPRDPATLPEEEEEDPKQRLIQRLVEYGRYRDAADVLEARPLLGRDVFCRAGEAVAAEERPLEVGVDAFGLLDAFYGVVQRSAGEEAVHEVELEEYSLSERVVSLLFWLDRVGTATLGEALGQVRTARQRVLTFLALLEMARLQMVDLTQDAHLGPVVVQARVTSADVDLSAIPAEA